MEYAIEERDMELNEFMNKLWVSQGKVIRTKNITGFIENVRSKAGTDLQVLITESNSGNGGIFSAEKLFAENAVVVD